MRKIFQRRSRASCALAVSLLLVAAPATAFATEASPAGEAPATTESGTGWVDQGAGGGDTDNRSPEAQRGSSLGSGGGAAAAPEVESSPAPTFVPAPVVEPETTLVDPSGEELESTAPLTPTDETVEAPAAPAPAEEPTQGIAGGASVLEGSSPSAGDGPVPLLTVPASGETEAKSSSIGTFPLVLAILLLLGLAIWFGRVAARHLRGHLRWRREAAEWKAAVQRLESAERPAPFLRSVSGNGAKGRRPARRKRVAPAQDLPAEPVKAKAQKPAKV